MSNDVPSPEEWQPTADADIFAFAMSGNVDRVRALLDAGVTADHRVPSWHGVKTPLHIAAMYGDSPSVVRLLLERGADPNARDELGFTPLMHVLVSMDDGDRKGSDYSKADMAQILLDKGADPTIKDPNTGGTAMDLAYHLTTRGFPVHRPLEAMRERAGLCRKCGKQVGSISRLFGKSQGTDHKSCLAKS